MKLSFAHLGIVVGVLISVSLQAATLDCPQYGFQMDPLDAPIGTTQVSPFTTQLPLTDGFSPNINVVVQTFTGLIKDYISLSKTQFDQYKFKVVGEKQVGDTEWDCEYAGNMQGLDLHFYCRIILKNGHAYLVTATAKESQWAGVGETLRNHVDSFKLK